MLEPCAVKVASTVLRGGGGSDATPLPDHLGMTLGKKISWLTCLGSDEGGIEGHAVFGNVHESELLDLGLGNHGGILRYSRLVSSGAGRCWFRSRRR